MKTSTPEQSTVPRTAAITQTQKQALIDNLQLEITERARKLRAQSALQAQGLRARLEMRVNRIPSALRKRNIQELIDEHAAKARPAPPPPMPAATAHALPTTATNTSSHPTKRKSDDISTGEEKENVPAQSSADLTNPKKRPKTTVVTANSKAPRTRNAGPNGVLSPKSHNSRTLHHSPVKCAADKTQPTRPMSAHAASAKSTRAPSRQIKRPATAQNTEPRDSDGSNASAGTTIVARPGARKPAVPKKTTITKSAPGGRTAVAKQEDATSTRSLRKRN